MIEATRTSTTQTTRRRNARRSLKLDEILNGDLTNGSPAGNKYQTHYLQDSNDDLDKTWNSMNYSDYVEYRRKKSGKSGNLDASRISNAAENEDGSKSPGFIFRYYKKFGYYWNHPHLERNRSLTTEEGLALLQERDTSLTTEEVIALVPKYFVFPKTDYCYLPGSPDYQKEVSPGIPTVPNLSRYPLDSYIKRGVAAGAGNFQLNHEADSRVAFSEKSLMSSTRLESSQLNTSSNYAQARWHGSVDSRKPLPNNHYPYHYQDHQESSWRRIKSLTRSILTVIKTTTVTTITTITHVTSSIVPVVTTKQDGSRSCNCLPLFLFLLFLLPLVFYLFPGVVGARQDEIITAVSSPANDVFSWALGSVYSAINLVKDSILYIPTIYFQIAALLTTNSSNYSKTDAPCPDLPAQMIAAPPPLPDVNLSSKLTEEKLLALQSEIIQKLKNEMAGQNHYLTAWIEQIQKQLSNLSEEVKKVSKQLEGDQKKHFNKLEGELADLKQAVIDVRDQAAVGGVVSPSERMVARAVAKYHADRTGKPDYALQSSGGYVVRVRCAQTYTKTTGNLYLFGLRMPWDISNGPETIIRPGVMPGECWAFEGSFAQVALHLATKVKVTSFSMEHSPKELALHGHISSAPKKFSVWAMENEYDDNPVFLGRFTFQDNGESLQQFEAIEYDQPVELIELKIESNHGHPEYTCLYRFRVHGVPSTDFGTEVNGTELTNPSGSRESIDKSHSKPYR